jgi:type II secretory pathway component PulK
MRIAHQQTNGRNRTSPRGMALVAVLWLIVILSFAVVTAVSLLNFQLDVADSQINGFRARMAAEMGISIGANPAVERDDPLLNYANKDGESYSVEIKTEGGRFNINFLLAEKAGGNDKRLIKEIFIRWGIDTDVAQEISDALMDWTDPNDEVQANGAEKEEYEKMGRLNQPFNRPFYSLDEVRLVRGWDIIERARPDWRDWFTVWSQGGLDINEADAEKISIAAECNPEDADSLVEIVRGPDGIRGTEDDSPFQSLGANENGPSVMDVLRVPDFYAQVISARLAVNDATVRIESTGIAGASKRKIILTLRNRAGKPAILEKKEEIIP